MPPGKGREEEARMAVGRFGEALIRQGGSYLLLGCQRGAARTIMCRVMRPSGRVSSARNQRVCLLYPAPAKGARQRVRRRRACGPSSARQGPSGAGAPSVMKVYPSWVTGPGRSGE